MVSLALELYPSLVRISRFSSSSSSPAARAWIAGQLAMASQSCAGLVVANAARGSGAVSAAASPVDQAAKETTQDIDCSANSIIMEPARERDKDVVIVFAPGALTPASDYIPLCHQIQQHCELRLWIVIINPPNNILSSEIIEGSFDGILQRLKALGFRPGKLAIDNVFVAGHSWGAWTARSVALRRAQAFIQIGSCFHTNPDNLSQYPKPVLTIAGERDGQLTLGATVKHAGEIFDVEEEFGSFNTYGRKPVVIVAGMNHAQTSNGVPNKGRGDLDAEIPIEEARAITGELVSAFVTLHVEPENSAALLKLEAAVKNTHAMFQTYWEALKEQGKDVERFQVELANPSQVFSKKQTCVIQHDYKDNFIYSKPWIELKPTPKLFVQTYLTTDGKYGIVKNLWIKMKSRDAVAAALNHDPKEESGTDPPISKMAAVFNERTFQEALALVPERARKLYENRGRKLRFVDDLVVSESAMVWIESDVSFIAGEDGFTRVQSPVLITPLEMAPRFAGMHYMKLLTLAGAMKWILEDCFRKT